METEERAHYSGLTLHRKCPQAWNYRYVQGLTRAVQEVAPPLDFGIWWSAVRAADALERGRAAGSLKDRPRSIRTTDSGPEFNPKTVTLDEVLNAASMWWEGQGAEYTEEVEKFLGQTLPHRLEELAQRWMDEWADERTREQPLAVEMYWERSLRTSEGNALSLFGFIDEVYYDTARELVVVRDGKTGRTLGTQTTADDMMDSQLHLYAWGASTAISKWGLGKVKAIAYDRVRSAAAKTPKITQAGSLSKQITDFDRETYIEWAKGPDGQGQPYPGRRKDGSDGGFYTVDEELVERLSSPSARSAWYQRTLTPLNVNLVKAHLQAAADTTDDQARTRKRVEETGEAARNLSAMNCRWCEFASLCRASMVGGPDGMYEPIDYGLKKV